MDEEDSGEIVIRGITTAGRQFRPSDWAERLAGVFSIMGPDQRVHYSRYVRPVLRSGCAASSSSGSSNGRTR